MSETIAREEFEKTVTESGLLSAADLCGAAFEQLGGEASVAGAARPGQATGRDRPAHVFSGRRDTGGPIAASS